MRSYACKESRGHDGCRARCGSAVCAVAAVEGPVIVKIVRIMKTRKVRDVMNKNPGWVIRAAVDRMLPKNTLRSRRLKRLTIVN